MGLFDFFGPKKTADQLVKEALQLRESGNRKKAVELLTKAVEQYNNADAMYLLGSIYAVKANDNLFDIKKAFNWWDRAVQNGYDRAKYSMALRLYYGEKGLKADPVKAVSLIIENHPKDFTLEEIKNDGLNYIPGILGAAFSDGIGVQQNFDKSRLYWEMGDQIGDSICTAGLSLANYFGANNFIQDFQEGVRLALKAVSKPCPYNSSLEPMGAYLVLADAYSIGNFVEKDINMSMRYCKKLDKLGFPNAKLMMENLKNYM